MSDEPSPPEAEDGNQSATNWLTAKEAHDRLSATYAAALAGASRVGEDGGERSTSFTDLFKPWLTRLLVEAHIRKRLHELRAIYGQLEGSLPAADDSEVRTWLKDARRQAATMAAGLASLQLPGFFVVVPFALTAIGFVLKIPGSVYASMSGLIVVVTWLGYVTLRDSFLLKRNQLFPASKEVDKRPWDEQPDLGASGRNVAWTPSPR